MEYSTAEVINELRSCYPRDNALADLVEAFDNEPDGKNLEALRNWSKTAHAEHQRQADFVWRVILNATDALDSECLAFCEACATENEYVAYSTAQQLSNLRSNKYFERVIAYAKLPLAAYTPEALSVLHAHADKDLMQIMHRSFSHEDVWFYGIQIATEAYQILFQKVMDRWEDGGKVIFQLFLENYEDQSASEFEKLLAKQFQDLSEKHISALQAGISARAEKLDPNQLREFWPVIFRHYAEHFRNTLWEFLAGKSTTLRELAAQTLTQLPDREANLEKANQLLDGGNLEARLGASAFFQCLADPEQNERLQRAIENEKSDKVRDALVEALGAAGGEGTDFSLDDITAQAKKLKLPKGNWLDLTQLPPLLTRNGDTLAEPVLTLLIAKQAKQKSISPAPELLPLLDYLARAQSSAFGLALFDQWLNSEQSAGDKWALALTGLLCDKRALPALSKPIKAWAENARHKLAEYAAQAIALIPGDEALMVLDGLANRYRSKFKNIGKACRAALEQAATVRGVSLDELADLIVPTLDFDEANERPLPETDIRAVLQPDFKLTFLNPQTEKETSSPPASLSEAAKADLKVLRKLITETVKGQSARLELCLVRQRRWPTPRWQELFEKNPFLQSFASRLVWATYTEEGAPLRTFRRYPNGLLANANGALVEFTDADAAIGMVHPLELDAGTLDEWRQHLGRMKVNQPFPQLERPTATLDPLHANRKQLATAEGKSISCGTFRSRAEKRGWQRGSVVDAGGISSYFKEFPGAGIEVYLHVEGMWVGQDAMDAIILGAAYFARAESVKTGSYIYDDPNSADDPRVVAFGEVSAVVYSETLTDLEAIIVQA